MKSWWGILLGVVSGILAAGVLLVLVNRPPGEAVRLLPPPTPQPIVVHVTGAVSKPGVYSLPAGARVEAALQAAGGVSADADLEMLNLAAAIHDGEQIWVPKQTEDPANPAASGTLPDKSSPAGLVNINSASQIELESLPGIGPVLAEAILEYRRVHGPFKDAAAIQDVPGIGPGVYEQIKDLITVWRNPSD
jgi:competence protein ComEA